jgi:hypothetical protein
MTTTTIKLRYAEGLPVSGLNLPDGTEIILNPGQTIELPTGFAEAPNVKSLIEDCCLLPVEEEGQEEETQGDRPVVSASSTTPKEDK